jgi:putative transposase
MTVSNELIDRLLADYKKPEDLIGENGLLKQLTKRLVERALEAELAEHLGHGKNKPVANPRGNTRNGKSKKTLKGEFGELPIEIPRDRDGSFEPQIVPKHQTRWTGFDDKILSLYARGMTVREIKSHLQEMYGAEVSPTLISTVTDAVMDEAKAWQSRPLDAWMRCIRSFTWTASTLNPETRGRSRSKRCTWRWALISPATSSCWACGSPKLRVPSSGCKWSLS